MFDKNTIPAGLILGILVPLICFPLLYGIFTGMEHMNFMDDTGFRANFKLRTSSLVAIGCNAFLLNKFDKRKATQSMRGVVLPTVVFVAIWVIIFGKTIL